MKEEMTCLPPTFKKRKEGISQKKIGRITCKEYGNK